jgi:hypothetical protein
MAISFFALVLICTLLFGVGLAIARGYLKPLVVVGVVVLLAMASLVGVRVQSRPVTSAVNIAGDLQTEFHPAETISRETLERSGALEPDVYPGVESLARGIVNRLAASLDMVAHSEPVERVNLLGTADSRILNAVRDEIGRRLPHMSAELGDGDMRPTTLPASRPLTVTINEAGRHGDGKRLYHVAIAGRTSVDYHTAMVEKLWLTDPEAFKRSDPTMKVFFVADRDILAASREEAEAASLQQAVRHVQDWLVSRDSNLRGFFYGRDSDRHRTYLLSEMEALGLIRDRLTQRFTKPYGTVWRSAALVQMSANDAARLIAACQREFSEQRSRVRTTILSGVGLILLVTAVYLFLNAATKGYYVWSLRIFGTLALVGGLAFLLTQQ